MDWMKIGSALLLVMFIAVIFPHAKRMLKESPEGSSNEWMSAIIPLLLVGGFIALLVAMV
jgi:hypothetical protein